MLGDCCMPPTEVLIDETDERLLELWKVDCEGELGADCGEI